MKVLPKSYENIVIDKIISLDISDIVVDLLHISNAELEWSEAFKTKDYTKLEELRRDEHLKNFGKDKQIIIDTFFEGEFLYILKNDKQLSTIFKVVLDKDLCCLYFAYIFDEKTLKIFCSKNYNQVFDLIKKLSVKTFDY